MTDCKHNRVIDKVKNGAMPAGLNEYYCTQCQKWVYGPQISAAAAERKKVEAERRRDAGQSRLGNGE